MLDVTVYLMEVREEEDDWDEVDVRDRRWTSLEDAADLLERHPVQSLIDDAKERLS